MNYRKLLYDPRWKALSRSLIENADCAVCGGRSHLNVHHKVYRKDAFPWEYSNDELVVLCQGCHGNIHEIAKEWCAFIFSLDSVVLYEDLGNLLDTLKQANPADIGPYLSLAARYIHRLSHARKFEAKGVEFITLSNLVNYAIYKLKEEEANDHGRV